MSEVLKMPRHVAIILDGNGRWAKAKGMPRNYGHVQGAKTVEVICEEAYRMGIQYLTVYAFSTENWNRPKDEVDALMKLLRNYMKTCLQTANKKLVRKVEQGQLQAEDLTEADLSGCLDTAGIPDPDLLIRTCNEQRISNFLLWQLAYTEFYFTPVPWPDFSKEELVRAVEAYNHRDRRYGGLKEE